MQISSLGMKRVTPVYGSYIPWYSSLRAWFGIGGGDLPVYPGACGLWDVLNSSNLVITIRNIKSGPLVEMHFC